MEENQEIKCPLSETFFHGAAAFFAANVCYTALQMFQNAWSYLGPEGLFARLLSFSDPDASTHFLIVLLCLPAIFILLILYRDAIWRKSGNGPESLSRLKLSVMWFGVFQFTITPGLMESLFDNETTDWTRMFFPLIMYLAIGLMSYFVAILLYPLMKMQAENQRRESETS